MFFQFWLTKKKFLIQKFSKLECKLNYLIKTLKKSKGLVKPDNSEKILITLPYLNHQFYQKFYSNYNLNLN